MKLPCELVVTHVLPTARGALAKELVNRHGMKQSQVAKIFGVTNAAISQYLKGVRGGNELIDKSAYKDDFYKVVADIADDIANGKDASEAFCLICSFVKESGLLKALYVFEGYSGDFKCGECPRSFLVIEG